VDIILSYGISTGLHPATDVSGRNLASRDEMANGRLGIEKARGTYLAFLDDDDLWIDGHLERSTAWLDKRPSHGFVYAPVILKNPSQNIERKHPEVVPVPTLENLFLSCTVQLPSVVARVSHVRAAGRFDESLRTGSDYDLWLRLAARAPFGVIDKISCIIHRHPGNITDSALRMYRGCLVVLQKRVDDLRSEISQTVIKQRMGRVSYLISRLAVGERNFKLAASSFFRALCFYPHIPGILYVLTLGRVPFGDNE